MARLPRIAVIAVHGIADQQPNDTNRAVASLLAEHFGQDGRPATYTPFESHTLQLPQPPVYPAAQQHQSLLSFEERRGYIERAATSKGTDRDVEERLGYEFMRMQLEGHTSTLDARSYETTVLRSIRRPVPQGRAAAIEIIEAGASAPSAPAHDAGPADGERQVVDVFEVFWADLSRLGSGALSFFGTLYQVLLHIGTLGRQAVDDAATEHPDSAAWRWINRCQRWSVRALTLFVPLLNVLLLCIGLAVVPAAWLLDQSRGGSIALALVGGAVAAAASYLLMRRRVPTSPRLWAAYAVLSLPAGAAAGWALSEAVVPLVAIAAALWLVIAGIMAAAGHMYQRLRAGAFTAAIGSTAVAAVAFMVLLSVAGEPRGGPLSVALWSYESATLRTMQVVFSGLVVSWFVVTLCGALLVPLWFGAKRAARKHTDPQAWPRARAALRTGRLALGLSAGPVLLLTIVLWAGVFTTSVERLHVFEGQRAADLVPSGGLFLRTVPDLAKATWLDRTAALDDAARADAALNIAVRDSAIADSAGQISRQQRATTQIAERKADITMSAADAAELTVPEYLQALLSASVTAGAPVALVLGIAGLVLLLWMALPSVRTEASVRGAYRNGETRRLGNWLSRGLDGTRSVIHLLFAAGILVPLAGALTESLVASRLPWMPEGVSNGIVGILVRADLLTYRALGTIGSLLLGSAFVAFGLLAKYGGSAVDVLLDIDNYLRTRPVDATPRARIAARYLSVLRYVASADDDGAPRYDGVVIIAHSLGALVTADLFLFLKHETANGRGDPALARLGFDPGGSVPDLAVTLFSMGNPLRQLLNRFFPHRYRWVRAVPDNAEASLPDASSRPHAADFTRPDPHRIGLARWESAYRSGDYVGRSLWSDSWYSRTLGSDDEGSYGEAPLAVVVPPTGSPQRGVVAEYCIGSGAHTHYWDPSAPDIADRLDALIADAKSVKPVGRPPSPAP